MEKMVTNKHPQYWRGINDAFELLYAYLAWFKENPDARDPQDYIMAARKAVARHCRSCLRELLAIPFGED